MIVAKLNLRCAAGHRVFAPQHSFLDWIGKECLQGGGMRADGFPRAGRCQHVLYPLKGNLDSVGHR